MEFNREHNNNPTTYSSRDYVIKSLKTPMTNEGPIMDREQFVNPSNDLFFKNQNTPDNDGDKITLVEETSPAPTELNEIKRSDTDKNVPGFVVPLDESSQQGIRVSLSKTAALRENLTDETNTNFQDFPEMVMKDTVPKQEINLPDMIQNPESEQMSTSIKIRPSNEENEYGDRSEEIIVDVGRGKDNTQVTEPITTNEQGLSSEGHQILEKKQQPLLSVTEDAIQLLKKQNVLNSSDNAGLTMTPNVSQIKTIDDSQILDLTEDRPKTTFEFPPGSSDGNYEAVPSATDNSRNVPPLSTNTIATNSDNRSSKDSIEKQQVPLNLNGEESNFRKNKPHDNLSSSKKTSQSQPVNSIGIQNATNAPTNEISSLTDESQTIGYLENNYSAPDSIKRTEKKSFLILNGPQKISDGPHAIDSNIYTEANQPKQVDNDVDGSKPVLQAETTIVDPKSLYTESKLTSSINVNRNPNGVNDVLIAEALLEEIVNQGKEIIEQTEPIKANINVTISKTLPTKETVTDESFVQTESGLTEGFNIRENDYVTSTTENSEITNTFPKQGNNNYNIQNQSGDISKKINITNNPNLTNTNSITLKNIPSDQFELKNERQNESNIMKIPATTNISDEEESTIKNQISAMISNITNTLFLKQIRTFLQEKGKQILPISIPIFEIFNTGHIEKSITTDVSESNETRKQNITSKVSNNSLLAPPTSKGTSLKSDRNPESHPETAIPTFPAFVEEPVTTHNENTISDSAGNLYQAVESETPLDQNRNKNEADSLQVNSDSKRNFFQMRGGILTENISNTQGIQKILENTASERQNSPLEDYQVNSDSSSTESKELFNKGTTEQTSQDANNSAYEEESDSIVGTQNIVPANEEKYNDSENGLIGEMATDNITNEEQISSLTRTNRFYPTIKLNEMEGEIKINEEITNVDSKQNGDVEIEAPEKPTSSAQPDIINIVYTKPTTSTTNYDSSLANEDTSTLEEPSNYYSKSNYARVTVPSTEHPDYTGRVSIKNKISSDVSELKDLNTRSEAQNSPANFNVEQTNENINAESQITQDNFNTELSTESPVSPKSWNPELTMPSDNSNPEITNDNIDVSPISSTNLNSELPNGSAPASSNDELPTDNLRTVSSILKDTFINTELTNAYTRTEPHISLGNTDSEQINGNTRNEYPIKAGRFNSELTSVQKQNEPVTLPATSNSEDIKSSSYISPGKSKLINDVQEEPQVLPDNYDSVITSDDVKTEPSISKDNFYSEITQDNTTNESLTSTDNLISDFINDITKMESQNAQDILNSPVTNDDTKTAEPLLQDNLNVPVIGDNMIPQHPISATIASSEWNKNIQLQENKTHLQESGTETNEETLSPEESNPATNDVDGVISETKVPEPEQRVEKSFFGGILGSLSSLLGLGN